MSLKLEILRCRSLSAKSSAVMVYCRHSASEQYLKKVNRNVSCYLELESEIHWSIKSFLTISLYTPEKFHTYRIMMKVDWMAILRSSLEMSNINGEHHGMSKKARSYCSLDRS